MPCGVSKHARQEWPLPEGLKVSSNAVSARAPLHPATRRRSQPRGNLPTMRAIRRYLNSHSNPHASRHSPRARAQSRPSARSVHERPNALHHARPRRHPALCQSAPPRGRAPHANRASVTRARGCPLAAAAARRCPARPRAPAAPARARTAPAGRAAARARCARRSPRPRAAPCAPQAP